MDLDFLFTPARIGRAGEDVALQIEAAIMDEKIKPGEGLPSERELQMQFKTGRGVIREAMRALKQKGLIEIRKGARGGAYVKQIDVSNVSESLALFLKQQHIGLAHIAEFRESIDRTITTLAIARADDTEKQQLVTEVEKLQECLQQAEPDMEALGDMDRELNIRLAKMTKNPIFEWIMRALQLGFSSQDYALYEDPGYRQKTVANWDETARHIADNEPLRAQASVGAHYEMLQRCAAEVEDAQRPANLADDKPTPNAD
ncbi:FadR/GntR family transcriptional regulator [Geopsychrobacter electrodiphilus]|uniref:FadR/GntR family transcriptional regulator n=1 Tax=Geopsychrobacter electrodiphilus TaxID=225196 RepID=UPI00036A261A|nr:GntR family transcriptional regulator [Geopsychrobacter electrodiphilus]